MGKSTLVHVCVGCVIPQRHSRHTATTTPITIATTTLGSKQQLQSHQYNVCSRRLLFQCLPHTRRVGQKAGTQTRDHNSVKS